jgi:hypothetical protein
MISIMDLAYYTANYMNVVRGLGDFAFSIYKPSKICSLTPAMPEALMPCHVVVSHAIPPSQCCRSKIWKTHFDSALLLIIKLITSQPVQPCHPL